MLQSEVEDAAATRPETSAPSPPGMPEAAETVITPGSARTSRRHALEATRTYHWGSVPVVAAGCLLLVASVGALAVDYGRMAVDHRKTQLATNQAAIAAASNLMAAESVATDAVSANKVSETSTTTVVRGRYSHDPMLPKEERFKPDPLNANAARVTVRTETPLQLAGLLTGSSRQEITAEATATSTAFGAFAIGNRTLSLQPALLNQILSGLLGAGIALEPSDYSALASTRIDMFQYLSALASGLRMSGVRYDRVVREQAPLSVALAALATAARHENGAETAASRALDKVAAAASRRSESFSVSALFSPGPYSDLMVGESPGGPAVTVGAIDLLNAVAQIGSGRRDAEATIDLASSGFAPSGILGATVRLAFAERPARMSWLKVGFEGVNIQSPQTRFLLRLKLRGSGAIEAMELPLVIELANASAQLSSVRCNYMQPSLSTMHVDARPAPVDAWIGDVNDFDFANMLAHPKPAPARIVDMPVLRVTGSAGAPFQTMFPNTLVFTQGEANMRLVKSVGAPDFTTNLVARLFQSLRFSVERREASEIVPPTPTAAISEMLHATRPAIERTLATTLDALGVSLGRVDVTPLGLRCDSAVLVQ